MCKTKSCWLTPSGDILHCEETDSHDVIARVHKIKDHDVNRELRAVRLEYTWPEDEAQLGDLSAWILRVDEDARPAWVTEDVLRAAREKLDAIVERMFVKADVGTVAGGNWIVLPGGRISELVGGRIVRVAKGANLYGANLRSANLGSADLRSANLRSADLRSANLGSANLGSADLRSADLHGANLRSADLRSADLRGANLGSADLRSADLRSANLGSADLRSADLHGADLRGADLLLTYPVPAGWTRAEAGALVCAETKPAEPVAAPAAPPVVAKPKRKPARKAKR